LTTVIVVLTIATIAQFSRPRPKTVRAAMCNLNNAVGVDFLPSVVHDANIAVVYSRPDSTDTKKIPVLFFHGATVPTSLTSALKIDGVSWFDALSENGRRVFGFDLLGYGLSDDYPRDFVEKHDSPYYYGVGNSLTKEVDSVVDYICATTDSKKINIIAISRGAIPAGYYTNEFSHKVNSFIMHAPIVRKSQSGTDLLIKYFGERQLPNIAYFPMSIDDRYTLLRDDKPEGAPSPLEVWFVENWRREYSHSIFGDYESSNREVKTPMGFAVDLVNAWNDTYFDESLITVPSLIFRGEWDNVLTPAHETQKMFEAISSKRKYYLQISESTHSIMYERSRFQLYQQCNQFLNHTD